MLFFVTGHFPQPEKLAPLRDEEISTLHALHEKGFVLNSYIKIDHSEVILIVETDSLETAKETLGKLPFAKAGLVILTYEEVKLF